MVVGAANCPPPEYSYFLLLASGFRLPRTMPTYRAAWLVPISSPPIRGGWLSTAAGRITAIGPEGERAPAGEAHDLGEVALMPALVNAHTHLELSWLRRRVEPRDDFIDWVKAQIWQRRASPLASSSGVPGTRSPCSRAPPRWAGSCATGSLNTCARSRPLWAGAPTCSPSRNQPPREVRRVAPPRSLPSCVRPRSTATEGLAGIDLTRNARVRHARVLRARHPDSRPADRTGTEVTVPARHP